MERRVTLRDIAQAGGVSTMAVSLALKNNARLPLRTRLRLQALARRLGYVPDPMLSSLAVYRQAVRPAHYHGTVAWITNHAQPDGWQFECYRLYREGADAALGAHGYRLEDFWLREPSLTARRASQVLHHRGIRGLLISPLPVGRGHLSLDWDKFSAVTFGYSMVRPKLHRFTAAHFQAMVACMRELRRLGFQKIGLIISAHNQARMDGLWLAAYRSELPRLPQSQSIPIFMIRGNSRRPGRSPRVEMRRLFAAWIRRHRPEVVINTATPAVLQDILEGTEKGDCRAPDDFILVDPALQEGETELAGIIEPSRQIGRAAANFLVGMMQRGECGIPEYPERLLIEGKWFPGKTLRHPTETGAARRTN